MTRLSHLLVSAILFVAASHSLAATPASTPEEMSLKFQDTKPLPGDAGYVQFVGYQDTRCPSNVYCAVAGEARVFLWVIGRNGRGSVVALPWSGGSVEWRRAVRAGEHDYLLMSLEPRPVMGTQTNPLEYKAVIAFRPHR